MSSSVGHRPTGPQLRRPVGGPATRAVGVGIVGTGVVFTEHARALAQAADRLRLVAVAELDEHRLRRATETCFIPFATNDHRVLIERDDVDVVVVCTPPSAHASVVADAIAAGKYVVCEKPLAPDLASVDDLIRLAEDAPGRLSTVHQWRYHPDVRRIIRLVEAGRLGELRLGRFHRFARLPAGHDVTGWWGRWDRAGGGAVMTQAIHEVDLMLHIFGRAASVRADVATLALAIESEDTATATVGFESGAMGVLNVSVATHEAASQFDVIGEVAGAHVPWRISARDERVRRQLMTEAQGEAPTRRMLSHPEVVRVRNKLRTISPRLGAPPAPPLHLGYWRAVADAIDADGALPVGPHEARRAVELVTAIYTSALEHREVALPLGPDASFYRGVTRRDYAGGLDMPVHA